jgi:hypothetical protein
LRIMTTWPARSSPVTTSAVTRGLLVGFLGLVILAGESFKVHDINIPGIVLLLLMGHLALVAASGRGFRLRHFDVAMIAIAGLFAALGAARYPAGDVFEDALPFVIFMLVVVSMANLRMPDHLHVYRFVIVASAVAFAKVLAIAFLDVQPEWGGNTFWQGSRLELASGMTRVILKGGDVFVSVSAAALLSGLMLRRRVQPLFPRATTYVLLVLLLLAVMMSFTRATIGAMAAAFFVWPFFLRRTGVLDWRRTAALLLVVVAGAVISLQAATWLRGGSPDGSWGFSLEEIGVGSALRRFGEGGDLALAYRQLEALEALAIAGQDGFLGSGFGAHYHAPLSGSAKEDGRSLYVHHLPIWLVLKVGIVGAVAFYLLILRWMFLTLRRISPRARPSISDPFTTLLATSLAGLLFLLFNDLLNNKFATPSGAAAYALLVSLTSAMPTCPPRARGSDGSRLRP